MSKAINTEFETKILNINVAGVEKRLKELHAEEFPEYKFKRYVYDFADSKSQTVRIRTDGEKTTLTYKNRVSQEIGGTEEIEIEVNDFETTAQIFDKLNFESKYYQENKRKIYRLNGLEFCIDTWPLIPTFMEIEGKSIRDVKEGLKLLGLEDKDSGNINHINVYNIYGIDLHSFKKLKF